MTARQPVRSMDGMLPVGQSVDGTTLRLLTRVWAGRRSGTCRLRVGGPAWPIHQGMPATLDGAERTAAALCAGGLLFLPGVDVIWDTEGAWDLGPLLLHAAALVSEPERVLARTDEALVELRPAASMNRLGISPELLAVVRSQKSGGESLQDVFDRSDLELQEHVGLLAALIAMGMLRLRPLPRRGPTPPQPDMVQWNQALRTRRSADAGVRARRPSPRASQIDELRRRLVRDWLAVADAGDHEALGLPESLDSDSARAFVERVTGRYQRVAQADHEDWLARVLAACVAWRLSLAAQRIQANRPRRSGAMSVAPEDPRRRAQAARHAVARTAWLAVAATTRIDDAELVSQLAEALDLAAEDLPDTIVAAGRGAVGVRADR